MIFLSSLLAGGLCWTRQDGHVEIRRRLAHGGGGGGSVDGIDEMVMLSMVFMMVMMMVMVMVLLQKVSGLGKAAAILADPNLSQDQVEMSTLANVIVSQTKQTHGHLLPPIHHLEIKLLFHDAHLLHLLRS